MSFTKRITAVLLAVCMLFALTACHSKNEIVMTIDDVEIGSGLYLLYLLSATNAFEAAVKEDLGEDAQAPTTVKEYLTHKVDDTDAETWIKNETRNYLKEYAWTLNTYDKYKLELGEYEGAAEYYTSYYWSSVQENYEANGISRDSFLAYYECMFKMEVIFNYLYGEDGPNEVGADEIYTQFKTDYVNTEYFEESYLDSETSEAYDEVALATMKASLDDLVVKINAGEMTVAQAKAKYEGTGSDSDDTSSTATSSTATSSTEASSAATSSSGTSSDVTSSGEEKPTQVYTAATLVYADDSTNVYPLLKDVTEYDKAVVYDDTDNSRYVVALVRDPQTDYEFYKADHVSAVLHTLRDDIFNDNMEKELADMKVEADDALVKFYSPKKIVESNS